MAKIYELSPVYEHITGKRRESFDPQRENLLGEDSICMVNLPEIPRLIVFFSYFMIALLRFFQKRSFVL